MLARALPILSLITMIFVGWFLYSSGTFEKIFRPSVYSIKAEKALAIGDSITTKAVGLTKVKVADLKVGMITFPEGTKIDDVEKTLIDQKLNRSVEKGALITSEMFGQKNETFVLRAGSDIPEGTPITMANIEAVELTTTPPPGVVMFQSQTSAFNYIEMSYDLTAKNTLYAGQYLTIRDAASGADKIYVIQATRRLEQSERLSLDAINVTEVAGKDLPKGAVAFPNRGSADVFVGDASKFMAARTVPDKGYITADVLAAAVGSATVKKDSLPTTYGELTAYMNAFPGEALQVFPGHEITGDLDETSKVDLWVETERTSGKFGEIRMKRLAEGVAVRKVYGPDPAAIAAAEAAAAAASANDIMAALPPSNGSPEEERARKMAGVMAGAMVEAAAEAEAAAAALDESELPRKAYFWLKLDPETSNAFEKARSQKAIAFLAKQDLTIVDQLGNGASCLEDRCQVNRDAANDLEDVFAYLTQETDTVATDGEPMREDSRLRLLSSVDAALEARLIENGYQTLEQIAAWEDSNISTITFQLDIAANRAFALRSQANIIVNSAEMAAQELGMDTQAPVE
jgi:predicted flap endonuclease-1-like 5' DNA nuclease